MPYCSHPDRFDLVWDHIILRAEVGSTVHGTGLAGQEDHDEMAVALLPMTDVLGLAPTETVVWRTADEHARSTPTDIDLVIHALGKYVTLAAAGNPSILLPLFTPPEKVFTLTWHGELLRAHRGLFITQRAGEAFLGYMTAQRKRLEDSHAGLRAPRVNRPELIAQHGYDTKYAMHMLRLGIQGYELISGGHITLPMPDGEGEYLRSVRRGEVSYAEVLERAAMFEARLRMAIDNCAWPERADQEQVDALLASLYTDAWRLS